MVETIKKAGFQIVIDDESGDVVIRSDEYHSEDLVIDLELAQKIFQAAMMKLGKE